MVWSVCLCICLDVCLCECVYVCGQTYVRMYVRNRQLAQGGVCLSPDSLFKKPLPGEVHRYTRGMKVMNEFQP